MALCTGRRYGRPLPWDNGDMRRFSEYVLFFVAGYALFALTNPPAEPAPDCLPRVFLVD